ncbi:Aldose 1-epimerase precursor [Pelagimonas phthalicica]|uniref:Aldose 1-epimerase n=1 Tax=Pelagimonas phthalicica TaxID=1037362 RepID=A0A238J8V7_9RHOB|nr:aldose epimerase family protein [Pelagimonas phthalicica]TDS95180.1 aldose 1-epimerase [Pelagimonas phthalicica]SMX26296.1 Aldose 1-epimerase precursor [Pelagimonas phthalicica]
MSDEITSAVLKSDTSEVTVLSMGCAIQSWLVDGQPVVLGYDNPEVYRENPYCMNIIVGRVANRTANSRFELGGTVWKLPSNDGPHHLHGGAKGLGWQNWDLQQLSDSAAILRLHSADLDQGYPGAVDFEVRLTLDGSALTWEMSAIPDRETPINLAQHVYFNLDGRADLNRHRFRINASKITPTGADLIPTGTIEDVDGTRFDFRALAGLAEKDPDGLGYDLNYVIDDTNGPKARVVAENGMEMRLWTDQPGLQFYTGVHLNRFGSPSHAASHGPSSGFCLEAQAFPNVVNEPSFGSILCSPDQPYFQLTTIDIRKPR